MVADDRSRRVPNLTSTPASAQADSGQQTACFDVGSLRLELSAAPGAARLVVSGDGIRDIYVVEPNALATWASATGRLLTLMPAERESERVEYRAPFLIDREGRASIAFEGLVTDQAVSYRLLVNGAEARLAGLMTTGEIVRQVSEAAVGAVAVASAAVRRIVGRPSGGCTANSSMGTRPAPITAIPGGTVMTRLGRAALAAILVIGAARAEAQITTVIEAPKRADTKAQAAAQRQQVMQDSIARVTLTEMKQWVDSAAGALAIRPDTGTAPASDTAAASPQPVRPRVDTATVAKPQPAAPAPEFRDGVRAPNTATSIPTVALAGAAMILLGALLRRRPTAAKAERSRL